MTTGLTPSCPWLWGLGQALTWVVGREIAKNKIKRTLPSFSFSGAWFPVQRVLSSKVLRASRTSLGNEAIIHKSASTGGAVVGTCYPRT